MRVVENTSERLVLQERYTVIVGLLLGVFGIILFIAAYMVRRGAWEIALGGMGFPALIVIMMMWGVPFVTVLSFDKRQGTLEVTHRHIAFGERRQAVALAEITSVDIITSSGGDDSGTSRSLRVSLRSGEPVILTEGGIGNFPERVRQICRFLELPELDTSEAKPLSPWVQRVVQEPPNKQQEADQHRQDDS